MAEYILLKDGKTKITDVIADCNLNLCVDTKVGESLPSILRKICGKITSTVQENKIAIINGSGITITGDGSKDSPFVISNNAPDTNFATHDLVATGHRSHDFQHHGLDIYDLDTYYVEANILRGSGTVRYTGMHRIDPSEGGQTMAVAVEYLNDNTYEYSSIHTGGSTSSMTVVDRTGVQSSIGVGPFQSGKAGVSLNDDLGRVWITNLPTGLPTQDVLMIDAEDKIHRLPASSLVPNVDYTVTITNARKNDVPFYGVESQTKAINSNPSFTVQTLYTSDGGIGSLERTVYLGSYTDNTSTPRGTGATDLVIKAANSVNHTNPSSYRFAHDEINFRTYKMVSGSNNDFASIKTNVQGSTPSVVLMESFQQTINSLVKTQTSSVQVAASNSFAMGATVAPYDLDYTSDGRSEPYVFLNATRANAVDGYNGNPNIYVRSHRVDITISAQDKNSRTWDADWGGTGGSIQHWEGLHLNRYGRVWFDREPQIKTLPSTRNVVGTASKVLSTDVDGIMGLYDLPTVDLGNAGQNGGNFIWNTTTQQTGANINIDGSAVVKSVFVNTGTEATQIKIQETGGYGAIWFGSSATLPTNTNYTLLWDAGTSGTNLNASDSKPLSFRINNSLVGQFTSVGKFLLGSITDQGPYKLQIGGDTYSNGKVLINTTDQNGMRLQVDGGIRNYGDIYTSHNVSVAEKVFLFDNGSIHGLGFYSAVVGSERNFSASITHTANGNYGGKISFGARDAAGAMGKEIISFDGEGTYGKLWLTALRTGTGNGQKVVVVGEDGLASVIPVPSGGGTLQQTTDLGNTTTNPIVFNTYTTSFTPGLILNNQEGYYGGTGIRLMNANTYQWIIYTTGAQGTGISPFVIQNERTNVSVFSISGVDNSTSLIGKLKIGGITDQGDYKLQVGGNTYLSGNVMMDPSVGAQFNDRTDGNLNGLRFGQWQFTVQGTNRLNLQTVNGPIYVTASAGDLNLSSVSGNIVVSNLTGTGTEMVVASSTGVLSRQAIPSGGGGPTPNLQQVTDAGNKTANDIIIEKGANDNSGPTIDFSNGTGGLFKLQYLVQGSQHKVGFGLGDRTWIYNFQYGVSGTHSYNFPGTGSFVVGGKTFIGGITDQGAYKLQVGGDVAFGTTLTYRSDIGQMYIKNPTYAGNAGLVIDYTASPTGDSWIDFRNQSGSLGELRATTTGFKLNKALVIHDASGAAANGQSLDFTDSFDTANVGRTIARIKASAFNSGGQIRFQVLSAGSLQDVMYAQQDLRMNFASGINLPISDATGMASILINNNFMLGVTAGGGQYVSGSAGDGFIRIDDNKRIFINNGGVTAQRIEAGKTIMGTMADQGDYKLQVDGGLFLSKQDWPNKMIDFGGTGFVTTGGNGGLIIAPGPSTTAYSGFSSNSGQPIITFNNYGIVGIGGVPDNNYTARVYGSIHATNADFTSSITTGGLWLQNLNDGVAIQKFLFSNNGIVGAYDPSELQFSGGKLRIGTTDQGDYKLQVGGNVYASQITTTGNGFNVWDETYAAKHRGRVLIGSDVGAGSNGMLQIHTNGVSDMKAISISGNGSTFSVGLDGRFSVSGGSFDLYSSSYAGHIIGRMLIGTDPGLGTDGMLLINVDGTVGAGSLVRAIDVWGVSSGRKFSVTKGGEVYIKTLDDATGISKFVTSVNGVLGYTSSVTTANDIEITDATKGIIMKTPDGTKRFRMTIDNNGDWVKTQL